jgi:hypothetical protein
MFSEGIHRLLSELAFVYVCMKRAEMAPINCRFSKAVVFNGNAITTHSIYICFMILFD